MEKMKVILWPLVTSFLITVVLMPFIIRYFKMKQFGQVIRDEGPSWHEAKSGTPTMGGIVIILSAILTVLVTTLKIGRASCREREEISEVAVALTRRKR